LSFLGSGEYSATLVRDDLAEPAAVHVERAQPANRTTTLEIELRPAGGFIGRFDAK
jgi:hypothetical protein